MSVRERGGGKSSVELLLELSKRIADQSLLDQNKKFKADPAEAFGEQVVKYFPLYIETFLSYTVIAILIHTFLVLLHRHSNRAVIR